jgi:thymidine phosphorylase
MNEPLASAAGNAVEVQNAVDFLTGRLRDKRLEDVTLALAAEMLQLAGLASSNQDGFRRAGEALEGGRAAAVFARMVSVLGGPADLIDKPEKYLPKAPVERPVKAQQGGFVTGVATRAIGLAVVELGGGRTRPEDKVDHAVGLTRLLPVGAEVRVGDTLALVHARNEDQVERASAAVLAAYSIGQARSSPDKAILRRVLPRN